jgi:hypothetical protein
VENPEEALDVLRHLPARRYAKMADVIAGLGEIR